MTDFKTYTITPEEKQRIISHVTELLDNRAEVIFAYIFGSFADKDAMFFRDIDIGVYITEDCFSRRHSL